MTKNKKSREDAPALLKFFGSFGGFIAIWLVGYFLFPEKLGVVLIVAAVVYFIGWYIIDQYYMTEEERETKRKEIENQRGW
jgi:uncharacterized membrane protein